MSKSHSNATNNLLNQNLYNIDLQNIGTTIKKKRIELNITQIRLAELIDVSPNFLGDVERQIKTPSLYKLIVISKILNTSLDTLVSGESHQNQNSFYNCHPLLPLINSLNTEQKNWLYNLLKSFNYFESL